MIWTKSGRLGLAEDWENIEGACEWAAEKKRKCTRGVVMILNDTVFIGDCEEVVKKERN